VDLRHDGGALSNGRRDAFSRAGPHVADGEHAGLAGLERQDSPAGRACALSKICSGHHEAFVVHRDAMLEPSGVRIGANEQEEVAERTTVCRPRLAVAEYRTSKSTDLVALQPDNFGVGV
jgi:hypothetical protein